MLHLEACEPPEEKETVQERGLQVMFLCGRLLRRASQQTCLEENPELEAVREAGRLTCDLMSPCSQVDHVPLPRCKATWLVSVTLTGL